MEDYTDEVIKTIALVLETSDTSELHADTDLERDLGFESGMYIELIMYLEDEIKGLSIDPASLQVHHFATVKSISDYINDNLNAEVA